MKRLLSLLFTFGFTFAISASAFAVSINGNGPPDFLANFCPPGLLGNNNANENAGGPFSGACALANVNGTTVDIPVFPNGKTFSIRGDELGTSFFAEGPGFSFEISGDFDPDPSISFEITATNTDVVSKSFHFFFLEAIVPVGFPNDVTSSLITTLKDGVLINGDGAAVSPEPPPAGIPTDGGADETAVFSVSSELTTPSIFTNLGVDVGDTFVIPGGQNVDGPINLSGSGPDPGSGKTWNFLRADVSFELSSNNDVVQFSGFGTINDSVVPAAVPEPGTLLILGFGLVALGIFRRHIVG